MAFVKTQEADVNSHNINLLSKINLFKADKQFNFFTLIISISSESPKINFYLKQSLHKFKAVKLFQHSSMKISLITATYNSLHHLSDVISSIRHQTYPNIEFIVIDGSSIDGTVEYLKQSNNVSQIISEPGKGIYDAQNKGIQMTTNNVVDLSNTKEIAPNLPFTRIEGINETLKWLRFK